MGLRLHVCSLHCELVRECRRACTNVHVQVRAFCIRSRASVTMCNDCLKSKYPETELFLLHRQRPICNCSDTGLVLEHCKYK